MNTSQSLERALIILELIDNSATPLGVREIARRVGLSTTIVQRLMNTLAAFNYLEQMSETRRYRIGPRAIGLGSSLLRTDKLISSVNTELQHLASEHGLSGFLGVLRGSRAIYLLAVQSTGPIAIRAVAGESAHLHSTAMGKALLADLDDAGVGALLGGETLPRLTSKTIVDLSELIADLQSVRRRGFATSIGENLPGVISVGASICGADGRAVAALSVAFAETAASQANVRSVAKVVLGSSAKLSRGLGCPASLLAPDGRDLDVA